MLLTEVWRTATVRTLLCFSAGIAIAWTTAARSQIIPASPHPDQRRPGTTVRIELIGDSTQTDNAGYGRGFCANLTPQVDCLNMAKGGASTKTFREQGLWDRSLATRPNYMVIQFGHNDMESAEHLDRQVSIAQYDANLRRFVTEARAHDITPVLVTPLTRRYFGDDGEVHSDLLAHAATMKRIAGDLQVPLIDLQSESITYLDKIGEAEGTKLGITKKDENGKTIPDKTHLNWRGSYVFGRMVAVGLGRAVPKLRPYVRAEAATLPAEGELAMHVLSKAPFKIVLVGDSTVESGGGWGPGFCATLTANVTCVDDALNGRSSKSFMDEGAWTKALNEKGQYYFIQFGHNDQKADIARHTDPEMTYADELRRYVADAKAIGAVPILVSSLSRRNYKNGRLADDGLELYAAAAKRVAAEEHVTFVDLFNLSRTLLNRMTQEQADRFDASMHPDAKAENAAANKPDRTHLNDLGKAVFGRMVADNVIRTQVELGPNVNGLPAGSGPDLRLQQAAPTDGK